MNYNETVEKFQNEWDGKRALYTASDGVATGRLHASEDGCMLYVDQPIPEWLMNYEDGAIGQLCFDSEKNLTAIDESHPIHDGRCDLSPRKR